MDWELKTFHGDEYSIKNGFSQNAYLIEEKNRSGRYCVVAA